MVEEVSSMGKEYLAGVKKSCESQVRKVVSSQGMEVVSDRGKEVMFSGCEWVVPSPMKRWCEAGIRRQ